MIVDGRALARDILKDVKERAERLPVPPSFFALAVAPSPATHSYLAMKHRLANSVGIGMEIREYDELAETDDIIEAIATTAADAIIVQLPLPDSVDTQKVLSSIPPSKDADVLSGRTREEAQGKESEALPHPVAAAVDRILQKTGVDPKGKRILVVGQGWLVGGPVAAWLRTVGAEVNVVTREAGDLAVLAKEADIIVSGAGSPGLITPQHVKEGAVIIDIGTSELGGSIKGDVDPAVAAVASVFTPVPGGVGPVTVACLLANVVTLAERHLRKKAKSVL